MLSGPARQRGLAIAAIVVSAVVAMVLTPPAALASGADISQRLFAAVLSAAIIGLAAVPALLGRTLVQRSRWFAIAAVALAAGVSVFLAARSTQRTCTAQYDGRAVLIGSELTPLGAAYTRDNQSLSTDELLFDAAGVPERLWTPASIGRCRLLVSSTYFLWFPLLVLCLFACAQAIPMGPLPVRMTSPTRVATMASGSTGASASTDTPVASAQYDLFISYRHGEPDSAFARELLTAVEARGYRAAIDERDFQANASFLQEMERCIRESRHTVAIISTRYLGSGHCEEEAIVCKVLDMGDRRRRLIPMIIEPVTLPAWLYGLVGIDCTKPDPLVDPIDKLQSTLGPPAVSPRVA